MVGLRMRSAGFEIRSMYVGDELRGLKSAVTPRLGDDRYRSLQIHYPERRRCTWLSPTPAGCQPVAASPSWPTQKHTYNTHRLVSEVMR